MKGLGTPITYFGIDILAVLDKGSGQATIAPPLRTPLALKHSQDIP